MTLIDFPRSVPSEEYERAVERIVATLAPVEGVRCIYQIGHVGTPGISDLDLLVIFDPSAQYLADPRSALDSTARYLFIHSLFGVTQTDFAEAMSLSFFHNYRLRWGQPELGTDSPVLDSEDATVLKRQVALEYMVRIYIGLFVALTYGIIKVRSLLLHAKALLYDCEFLDIQDGEFWSGATRLVNRRNAWFTDPARTRGLAQDAAQLCHSLGEALNSLLKQHRFYLPVGQDGGLLARHIAMRHGPELAVRHRGLKLPGAVAAVTRKYVNFLDRLNRFEVVLPFNTHPFPPVIQRAFDLRGRLDTANRQVCPRFMSLSTGFTLQ